MSIMSMQERNQGLGTKIIIGLIVIAFGFFGLGSITTFLAPVAKVATINGVDITQQEMEIAVERRRRMQLANNASPEDIDEDSLKTLPQGIETFVCDVSESSNLDQIFDEILPQGLDILVNNAGISGPTKPVEEISDGEWDSCMAVGINAQFYCVRRVVPIFKKQQKRKIELLIIEKKLLSYISESLSIK